MTVKIRLTRCGKKNSPFYHVVVADSRSPRDGKFIEKLGFYNPLLEKENPESCKIDKEKAAEWIKKGAQPTERVAKLLIQIGTEGAEKFKPVFIPKIKEVKAEEVKVETKAEEVKTEEVVAEEAKTE